MSKNDFSRINVDVRSLNVSAPGRSGFDLSKSSAQSVPFGKLFPVRCTKLIPTSTVKGSVAPDLQLEKFATPAAGRMRLDTHTFIVAAKRIHNGFKSFIESGMTGRTAQNLPTIQMGSLYQSYLWSAAILPEYMEDDTYVLEDIFSKIATDSRYLGLYTTYNPSTVWLYWLLLLFQDKSKGEFRRFTNPDNLSTYNKNLADWFATEADRCWSEFLVWNQDAANRYPALVPTTDEELTNYENSQMYFGDFLYIIMSTLFGEGSTFDQLGYPVFSYFGELRERMNEIDRSLRAEIVAEATTPGTWDADALDAYVSAFGSGSISSLLYVSSATIAEGVKYDAEDWDVALSEMPLRANYAVWFDYFRDWHLDPETSCPNPDDFGQSAYCQDFASLIALGVLRHRNWSRDGFTMVQPDDVYRHVYAPATGFYALSEVVSAEQDGFDSTFKSILSGELNKDGSVGAGVSLPFPSSFTTLFGVLSDTEMTFYHDLQVMRRAEMLKRKLTRDYYNPDTYVGQYVARWGVEPADFAIQCTQYLGGNETMISGEQVTSPVETENTTLGQRTMVANASSNDSFTYNMSEHAYLLSYVSIVPLVHYDALNATLQEISVHDQVIPEYANDNQVVIRACDLVRDLFQIGSETGLGYVPRYYGYRMALDDAHGKYLREYRSYIWLRDRYTSGSSMLTKNAINAHINMPLDCFIGLREWDTIAFGNIQLPLYVECPLPDKLENV